MKEVKTIEATHQPVDKPVVGLFVTCLVDMMRPKIAFATIDLLERAGARVVVPSGQTCCGQIAYNAGNEKSAKAIAKQVMECFQSVDYIVVPSGSCASMVSKHFPKLFVENDTPYVQQFAEKCWELTAFLVNVMRFDQTLADLDKQIKKTALKIAYHDSCSGLRELDLKKQPRKLLSTIGFNEHLDELARYDGNRCCGFGGSFCVTCPDVSAKMADDKINALRDLNAEILVSGDLGCLLHMSGRMSHVGNVVKTAHIAEVLSDSLEGREISSPNVAEDTKT